ncbi:membrane protein [Undibacterium terreum]|uniref:Membrane protein n=1 Tax=Undibacterium terreum TaxID=1224302 RepID=A0A916XHA3_9BURK|nr:membrane protein [Undibacterium terreum]
MLAANLPFFNERLFALIPLGGFALGKPLPVRLLELIIFYFIVGGIAFALESNAGNRFEQGWEFYAVTGCLFIVLSFPGFVIRYLKKKHV